MPVFACKIYQLLKFSFDAYNKLQMKFTKIDNKVTNFVTMVYFFIPVNLFFLDLKSKIYNYNKF